MSREQTHRQGQQSDNGLSQPEKRSSQRIPADLELTCCNRENFGTLTNLSMNGMFIKSKNISFPFQLQFEISIPLKEETLSVPVRVSRITKSNGYYDGIGVELLKRPGKYIKFMNRMKNAAKNGKNPAYSVSIYSS
ncbi:MAG: PilZ domain-containing protein [Nitrospiraceae bacterium]|nr:MAG: PilZ domain-containing protein [Nitrospiraceae bacterium]